MSMTSLGVGCSLVLQEKQQAGDEARQTETTGAARVFGAGCS